MGDKTRGLYDKFKIERTDGKSAPGEKHYQCRYFVLDLDHDVFARIALAAYANACEFDYPLLSSDLWGELKKVRFGRMFRLLVARVLDCYISSLGIGGLT